ncbi:MAG: helix-turn-helix domain-containing protein [Deltaproteobacteria bacterium]
MKKMLTVKEVAELVRLNEATVYKLAKEGKIPAVRFEKQWRVREEALEVWLREQESSRLGLQSPQVRQISPSPSSLAEADDFLEKTVVRKSKRKKIINTDSNVEFEMLTADINRKQMESRQLNIRVGGELEFPPFPNGEIWGMLLEGLVSLELGPEQYHLEPGDSVHFSSSLKNRWFNPGKQIAKAVVVINPPIFV